MEISGSILNGKNEEVAIRKIKHGEIITEPGIYDIPMSWYHDNCCDGPSISSSGLRTIVNKSPLHYWDTSPLNPERRDDEGDEDPAHFRIGRAGHTLLLEPADFKKLFVTRPPQFDSWRTKDSQAWRASMQADGFTVLDPKEMQNVQGVASALRRHPLYEQGLLDGDIERSLIWRDKKTGIWLKSRPDAIPLGSNIFADLKIVSDARTKPLRNKIYDLGYDVQMALAFVGMWEILQREMEEFVVVAVEVKPPNAIRIAPIPKEEIKRALILLRHGIDIFFKCWVEKDWPSFAEEDNEYLPRHDYAAKRIDEMVAAGRLPTEF